MTRKKKPAASAMRPPHRRLIFIEAVLLANLALLWVQDILRSQAPITAEWSTLLGMVGVFGTFGGLFVLLQRWMTHGIRASHRTLRALMGRSTRMLAHAVVLSALYLGYHWLWTQRLPTLQGFGVAL